MSFVMKSKKTIPYILNGQLFTIIEQVGENVTVKCIACPPERLYRGSFKGTGNFHMHIKRRHPELLGQLHDLKIQNLLQRKEVMMGKNRQGTIRKRIKKEKSENHQISIAMEEPQPLDFSNKKCDHSPESPPVSSSGSISPLMQMFQQDYVPVSAHQTVIHDQPSVKSEDEVSEILDLSIRPSIDRDEMQLIQPGKVLYEQMLQRIESCFNGIREELKHRNEIEAQRIAVEVAKFKYLHPYFSYDL